jgi:predicted transcriptional regulator
MPRTESEHPTDLELDILKVLWKESPLPVRDVRARLEADAGRPLAHSSVITMLNIMHRKGFLKRRKVGNAFVFSPKAEKEGVAGKMMRHLVTRVFDGSTSAMVLSLIETSDIDAEELTELRRIISRKAKEQQK